MNRHILPRGQEAVSPVIAIILMVAITVVLAGVLYVWVTSLADTDSGDLDMVLFDAELSAGDQLLTLEMTRGDPILWNDHKLTMNGTTLSINVSETKVGQRLLISITPAEYPNIHLVAAETYPVQLINIDDQAILWEKDVICKT